MQNDEKEIPLSVKVETLKKMYDDLRSKINALKNEEEVYSSFLSEEKPLKQQKISNEIEKLVSEFDNYQEDRAKNLSDIIRRINLIAHKVALKEKHVAKMSGKIIDIYESNYSQKTYRFIASCNANPERDPKLKLEEKFMYIRGLYSDINEVKYINDREGKQPQYSHIIKIIDSINYIRDNEAIIDDKIDRDFHHIERRYDELTLKPSTPFDKIERSKPVIVTINGINVGGANQSFPPVRFSPQIGNLEMAGATVFAIFFARRLWNKWSKEKEPEIKPEIKLKSKDIDEKLALILDDNIKFDSIKSSIEFNNFSQKFCQKMKIFFINEGLEGEVSNDINKGLTLKKLNLLTVDKFNQVFDKFLTQFKDDLDLEKQQIAQKKQAEEDSRTQQEKITELQDLVNKAIIEFKNIKIGEGDKSRSGKAKESDKEEIKARQKYEKEQRIISEKVKEMENYAKDVKKFESILSQEQIDFFNKKFIEFSDLIPKSISFEAVRKHDVKRQDQNPVEGAQIEAKQEQAHQDQVHQDQVQDNRHNEIPASAAAPIQNLSMPDLIKLKALFLEEGYTKIYYLKAQDNSPKFEELSLGFLHHEALDSKGFENKYRSPENQQSFREFGGLNLIDKNLAKHYFHNLLESAVDDIYQRNTNEVVSEDEAKKSIKDNLYSFLNYAMGDMDSVLKDYEKREIEGESRGGLTGLGHASGAKLEDSEKLCLCLKMFKDGGKLSTVNPQQLQEFTEFKAFVPKFKTEEALYEAKEIPIQEKSDDIFAQNLISELNNQSNKLSGQERLENVVKDFFSSNAEKILEKLVQEGGDYSQKISQVFITTKCDGDTLQYLEQNPEIVKDIVDFANCKDVSVPSKDGLIVVKNHEETSSLKDKLKSACKKIEEDITKRENRQSRAL